MTDKQPSGMPPLEEEFYRRLLADAAPAMLATDAQFRIVCWNRPAGELLGVQPEAMLGQSVYSLAPDDRHRLLGKLLERTVRRRENTSFEVRRTGADGEDQHLVLMFSPIPGEDDTCRGVAAWILDETRRKRLAERLAQAEKMAALGTLAGGVAHHFNNILGGVATFVDFALTSGDTASMKRALQMTAEAASRAAKITQSLLSFAKEDSRRADLADLTEVVLTFSHLVERPLSEHGITLDLDLAPVPIVAVEANRMHQVLGNLLSNAEEAMPAGGQLTISIRHDAHDVLVSFADTGCGIKPEHLPLVFEPFFTTKGLLSGGDRANPGLGLSVVHGIVLEMGGSIDVTSQLGHGTKFLLRFPLPEED